MGMVNALYDRWAPTPSLAPRVSASRRLGFQHFARAPDSLSLRDGPPEALPSPPDAFRSAARLWTSRDRMSP